NVVTKILEDSQYQMWIGTAFSGLNLFNPKDEIFHRFQYDSQNISTISGNNISSLYEDAMGNIWVGAQNKGLNKYNQKNGNFTRYQKEEKSISLPSNTVYSIIEDEEGNLMLGGMNGGISLYNYYTDNFSRYDTEGNYNPFGSKASVYCHYKLNTGEVAIATSNGGIKIQNHYTKDIKLFQHNPENSNSLSMNNISAIAEGENGEIWLGTLGGGLNRFDSETEKFQNYQQIDELQKHYLKDKTVNWILPEGGNLWLGTLENGLVLFKNGQFKYFDLGSDHNTVTALFKEENGNFWIGTDLGIYLFDESTGIFQRPAALEKFSDMGMVEIIKKGDGNTIWIGTETGLYKVEEDSEIKKIEPYKKNRINNIFKDRNGNLWISSLNNGLSIFDGNTSIPISILDGKSFFEEIVSNILEDSEGFYWVTCSKGLLKCKLNELKHKLEILKKFDGNDGLQPSSFNENAATITKNGEIILGGLEGFNIFDPVQLEFNPNPPPVVFTSVKANGKDLKYEKSSSINLKLKEASSIDFSFAALNFIHSNKNQYAYKLENYDNKWHYSKNENRASYGNLDPGSYTFRVKASNNDGIWNDHGITLNLNIYQSFWQSPIFQGVGISILLLIGISFFYIEKQKRQKVATYPNSELLNSSASLEELIQKSEEELFLENAILIVQQNLANHDFSINDMCTELGVSRAQLFRKIKKLTGEPVADFIKGIRLSKAKRLLVKGSFSVGEVADATGFKSHSHFSRLFKDKFGTSPSAFIKNNKA
ncbi:MAG: helix-turn-helix domain-containing protein, partial [Flammeovirgaceae bacterium]|nr:helix-turn-helix domain-containing protein [Flammeovirgaceae bacterium]